MRGKGMTQRMAIACFGDIRITDGFFNGFLHNRFMHMMASFDLASRINGSPCRRKDILPCPGPVCMLILSLKGIGQIYTAETCFQIHIVDFFDLFKVTFEQVNNNIREHGNTVLTPLTVPHQDLFVIKINVFDPKAQTFHDS